MGEVAGWEITTKDFIVGPLKVLEVPFVLKEECNLKLPEGNLGESLMCAGEEFSEVSTCDGNHGAGLVFKDLETNAYYLRGLLIASSPTCSGGSPNVFTKLSTQKEFIGKYLQYCNSLFQHECGKSVLKRNTRRTLHGEFPWHAAIYRHYTNGSYEQICGGTLISRKIVITAANCFNEKYDQLQATIKVAVGNYYKGLDHQKDDLTQIVDVDNINMTGEIASVMLKYKVKYTRVVRPVCIDFGTDKDQLTEGAVGKIVGWNFNIKDSYDAMLKVMEMPVKNCPKHGNHLSNYTNICAENFGANARLCEGDNGGGLVFEDPITRAYYLRGIFVGGSCQYRDHTSFTDSSIYEELINNYTKSCEGRTKQICGRSASRLSLPDVSQERPTKKGEFPWYTRIYERHQKNHSLYEICSGTLISTKVVISAASCFYKEEIKPGKFNIDNLVVAFWKYYWVHKEWFTSFPVDTIEISSRYLGRKAHYANDIAILVLKAEVEYSNYIRPVCLDMGDDSFEDDQLKKGQMGMMLGWGETKKLVEMPFAPRDECVRKISVTSLPYVSRDKICAGDQLSKATVCKNDTGAGLVFEDRKTNTYYLRGVVSLVLERCEGKGYVLFTKISSHRDLIQKYLENCTGNCEKSKCKPLISKKLHIQCFAPNSRLTRCDTPLASDSKATFYCNPSNYIQTKEPEYNLINCKNGEWDQPLVDDFCESDCGRSSPNLAHRPVIINGKQIKYGEFPWHAGIYQYNESSRSYDQICGGTLVSRKVVISAAHCFANEGKRSRKPTVKDNSSIKVAVGKYNRIFNASEDFMAQIVNVESINLPPQYLGSKDQYDHDIAFLTLKTEVNYSEAVRPICLDLSEDNFENDQLKKGNTGKVVGWGLTEEGKFSETLIMADMPFVPRDECVDNITNTLLLHANRDKIICAGEKSWKSMSVCQGDSGSGLVFQDPDTKAYYLRGIVSLGPKGCKGTDFALFTKLSSYKDFVKKYVPRA